jgi:hypothetical protein
MQIIIISEERKLTFTQYKDINAALGKQIMEETIIIKSLEDIKKEFEECNSNIYEFFKKRIEAVYFVDSSVINHPCMIKFLFESSYILGKRENTVEKGSLAMKKNLLGIGYFMPTEDGLGKIRLKIEYIGDKDPMI